MERTHTITVSTLMSRLKKLPGDTKVFLSNDSEGNSYSSIANIYPFQVTEDGKAIIIWPFHEGLDLDDIDAHASIRSDYYNKIYEESIAQGKTRDQAVSIAIKEAYDSDAPFNN